MLKVLDPHSPISIHDFAAFKTEQRSEYFGIGATIDHMHQGDQVNTYIRATFDESPAARAGLRFGDRILKSMANRWRIELSGSAEVPLRPARHCRKITVLHNGSGQKETVSITRDAVPLPSGPRRTWFR